MNSHSDHRRAFRYAIIASLLVASAVSLVHTYLLGLWNFSELFHAVKAAHDVLELLLLAISLIIVFVAYRSVRAGMLRKSMLDLLFEDDTDEDLILARDTFHLARKENLLTLDALDEQSLLYLGLKMPVTGAKVIAWKTDPKAATRRILNRYEMIALGIFEGALSEEVYFRAWKGALFADWATLQSLVNQIRKSTGNQAVYTEFERLVQHWQFLDSRNRRPAIKWWI